MSADTTAINDATPVTGEELAQFMRLGKNAITADKKNGYVFEFATRRMTTPGHYKAWLREQAILKELEKETIDQADEERLQRELRRLRSGAGKSHEPRSNRGSRKPSLPRAKSSGSKLPA